MRVSMFIFVFCRTGILVPEVLIAEVGSEFDHISVASVPTHLVHDAIDIS